MAKSDTRNFDLMCQAVVAGHLVALSYGGYDRLVEPHLHGYTAAGEEVVLCWQREGGSISADSSHWRLFRIRQIEDFSILEAAFAPRPDFSPLTREIRSVHCGPRPHLWRSASELQ